MQFWSLGRSGLFPVVGRPTLRAFRAAVASCGAPKVRVGVTGDRSHRFVELGLEFYTGDLFRCHFTIRSPSWARTKASFWYRADGQPRRFKPSRFNNPVSFWLNRALLCGDYARPLGLRERVLLALGF